ncbi:hypothetical protein BJ742DRAFT_741757 [Cladochytrium replicatum]|nr:hypothetical protein BJ742DRAFT_741757 [Cladochytrium replicatum]
MSVIFVRVQEHQALDGHQSSSHRGSFLGKFNHFYNAVTADGPNDSNAENNDLDIGVLPGPAEISSDDDQNYTNCDNKYTTTTATTTTSRPNRFAVLMQQSGRTPESGQQQNSDRTIQLLLRVLTAPFGSFVARDIVLNKMIPLEHMVKPTFKPHLSIHVVTGESKPDSEHTTSLPEALFNKINDRASAIRENPFGVHQSCPHWQAEIDTNAAKVLR